MATAPEEYSQTGFTQFELFQSHARLLTSDAVSEEDNLAVAQALSAACSIVSWSVLHLVQELG